MNEVETALHEWNMAKIELEMAKKDELEKRLRLVRLLDSGKNVIGRYQVVVKHPTYLKPKDMGALMARIDEAAAQGKPVKEIFDFKVSIRAKYKTHPLRVLFEDLIIMSTGTPQVTIKEVKGE